MIWHLRQRNIITTAKMTYWPEMLILGKELVWWNFRSVLIFPSSRHTNAYFEQQPTQPWSFFDWVWDSVSRKRLWRTSLVPSTNKWYQIGRTGTKEAKVNFVCVFTLTSCCIFAHVDVCYISSVRMLLCFILAEEGNTAKPIETALQHYRANPKEEQKNRGTEENRGLKDSCCCEQLQRMEVWRNSGD